MKRKYKVVLPISIEGKVYNFGEVIELDPEVAERDFPHAVIEEKDGPA